MSLGKATGSCRRVRWATRPTDPFEARPFRRVRRPSGYAIHRNLCAEYCQTQCIESRLAFADFAELFRSARRCPGRDSQGTLRVFSVTYKSGWAVGNAHSKTCQGYARTCLSGVWKSFVRERSIVRADVQGEANWAGLSPLAPLCSRDCMGKLWYSCRYRLVVRSNSSDDFDQGYPPPSKLHPTAIFMISEASNVFVRSSSMSLGRGFMLSGIGGTFKSMKSSHLRSCSSSMAQ